ncbi:hypothetical protein L596_014958 [Steinernema carpocapsae]|uniref:Uncharacterized protein n=1 Tax=Steinernema carpocapsae TaxID=34508 RepID=A0A4U5NDS4_STECR|nr:hypothetical protein L596_014958 [Steinernema carpocapsae]
MLFSFPGFFHKSFSSQSWQEPAVARTPFSIAASCRTLSAPPKRPRILRSRYGIPPSQDPSNRRAMEA